MSKLFKTGFLSFLACSILFQSSIIGYSSEIKEFSNTSDDTIASYNSDNDPAFSDEITQDDLNDDNKDYTDGLKILQSDEVSEEYAREYDPLYKKYMGVSTVANTRAKKFGVTQPTTPSALVGVNSVDGIDVSMYQAYSTPIDWNKVKAAGISYAIIRCGYRGWGTGEIVADSYFKQNIEGALASGLQVGVYFYTQAITTTEAKQEADFCKNAVKGYDITLPIYIDIENANPKGRLDSSGLSKAEKTNICKAFANRVQSANYTGGVYANKTWLLNYIDGAALAKKYAIWLAHYTTNTDYTGEFSMWQYSSRATINGIKGSVDVNKNYLTKPHQVTNLIAAESTTVPSEFILSWTRAAGAYKYQVKTFDESTNKWVSLGTTKSNKFTVTEPYSTEERQYKVRAFKLIGTEKIYGAYSSIVTFGVSLTKVSGLTQTAASTKSVTIKWNQLSTAAGYYIYMYNENKQEWAQVKTLSGIGSVSTKITGLDYSTVYKFKVQGYSSENGTIVPLSKSSTLKAATTPKKAGGLKYTSTAAKKVTLSWKVVDRASGYNILRYNTNTKKYEVCKTVSGKKHNSAEISGLKSGTKHKFKVEAYKLADQTAWPGKRSSAFSISTIPAKVTGLKYSFSGSKCTLKWKACIGAVGYEVQKYNKASKSWTTVQKKKQKSVKYKFTLNKNNSVKLRVRAFKSVKGKRRYGSYSSAKNVKH